MSDEVLKLIPVDRNFIPKVKLQKIAIKTLEKLLPEGEMCEIEVYDYIEFIDQGEYLEYIICPNCKTKLNFFDKEKGEEIDEWWHNIMDNGSENGFNNFNINMICCNEKIDITNLEFYFPAGFAKFELSIWNPNLGRKLNDDELKILEEVLNCKLIQIWAHY